MRQCVDKLLPVLLLISVLRLIGSLSASQRPEKQLCQVVAGGFRLGVSESGVISGHYNRSKNTLFFYERLVLGGHMFARLRAKYIQQYICLNSTHVFTSEKESKKCRFQIKERSRGITFYRRIKLENSSVVRMALAMGSEDGHVKVKQLRNSSIYHSPKQRRGRIGIVRNGGTRSGRTRGRRARYGKEYHVRKPARHRRRNGPSPKQDQYRLSQEQSKISNLTINNTGNSSYRPKRNSTPAAATNTHFPRKKSQQPKIPRPSRKLQSRRRHHRRLRNWRRFGSFDPSRRRPHRSRRRHRTHVLSSHRNRKNPARSKGRLRRVHRRSRMRERRKQMSPLHHRHKEQSSQKYIHSFKIEMIKNLS